MMTYFIFAGDMLVMAFMIGVVMYVSLNTKSSTLDEASRIPLEDEDNHG
jgi:cbb3-type cytochrome oxidase subunit 3